MITAIQEAGGRIDAIYYAPAADRSDNPKKAKPYNGL